MNILVADDEEGVARTLAMLLTFAGHHVETASNGRTALDKLLAPMSDFQLLISDSTMPVMGGLELIRTLRTSSFKGQILALSGQLTQMEEQELRASGVKWILPKPFDIGPLMRALVECEETRPGEK